MRSSAFISYSRKDKKLLDELRTWLVPLERNGLNTWCDENMRPGTKWQDELQKALNNAKVAVLLVTPNFLASSFIHDTELPAFYAASEEEGLTILCVHFEASNYKHTKIHTYQSANDPDQPLASLTRSERQQALQHISDKILAAMAENIPDS
jgi:hypothetical protein